MYNVRPYLLTIVYGDMDHERLVAPRFVVWIQLFTDECEIVKSASVDINTYNLLVFTVCCMR